MIVNGFRVITETFDPHRDDIQAAFSVGASVKQLATKADVAINFNYADTITGTPIGRVIVDGETVIHDITKTKQRDELYMLPDRSLHIGKAPSDAVWVVQGSPPLLKDGKRVNLQEYIARDQLGSDIWQRPNIRIAAGITAIGRLIVVKTLDNVTLEKLQDIMLEIGCVYALNGDGGGSSYFYPHDNGWGRKLGSALIINRGVEVMDIKQDFIKVGANNRPGHAMSAEYITIHDTGNPSAYADADAHGAYLQTTTAANRPASWHFTVDDQSVVQHLPINESGWHAGDGNGPGNRKSIGVEICENADGNRLGAEERAAELIARLLKETGLSFDKVVQHNKWSGKDCPKKLRPIWSYFIAQIQVYYYSKLQGGSDMFKDVPSNHWAATSIRKAAAKGVLVGVSENEFGPNETVTRAQMAVILDRIGVLDKEEK